MQVETARLPTKKAGPLQAGAQSARGHGTDLAVLLARVDATTAPGMRFLEDGKWVTKRGPELARDVRRVVANLVQLGIERGARVGLLGHNSYAWVVYDLALLAHGCVSVALPETAPHEWSRAIERLGVQVVFSGMEAAPSRVGLRVLPLTLPVASAESAAPPAPCDEPTLVFSSGTSGRLKCLRVSRAGIEHAVDSLLAMYPAGKQDRLLLFLPLSNMQQRVLVYGCLYHGIPVVLSTPQLVLRGLREAAPTIILAPPLFYEHIHGLFLAAPAAKRLMANAAALVLKRLPFALRGRAQRALFRPIYQALGGQPSLMITGMAPIRRATLDFFRDAGLPLYEAYGLTECGLVTGNSPKADRLGAVGRPFEPGAVTLAEDGEIVVRSSALLSTGYVDEPDEALTFAGKGVVCTGDIGRYDADGFLYIVGRKKEVIITASGHKVHPEMLEAVLNDESSVERAAVVLSSDGESLMAVARLRTGHEDKPAGLKAAIMRANEAAPSGIVIRSFALLEQSFSIENGLLTRNLKVDRRAARSLALNLREQYV